MKASRFRLKSLVRWLILGGTLFFLGKVLKDHWQKVLSIQIDETGFAYLAIALGVTLLAHICAGWVWTWLLQDFSQPVQKTDLILAYLRTTIAKYLPGNIWHYYGRIKAATEAGAETSAAIVSVLLEPILMAAAALLITLLGSQQVIDRYGLSGFVLLGCSLVVVLTALHPRILNLLIRRLGQSKALLNKSAPETAAPFAIPHYPLLPLVGELGFLLLRGVGFLFTILAVYPIALSQAPILFSAFSLSWLLGLVVPGAPGGIGVFEAMMIALLSHGFPPPALLSAVAFYRLISVLAEAIAAGLAGLEEARITA